MDQDIRKVSIKLPSDLLKELSALNEQNKVATDQGTITLQATTEQLSSLGELRRDMADFQRSKIDEWHSITDSFIKTSEMRISFYEKLILLVGGSFALSLTFVGSLHRYSVQNSALAATGRLKTAWVLLLVCIVFSWLHNFYRSSSVEHLSAANTANITAMQHALSADLIQRAAILIGAMETPSAGLGNLFAVLSLMVKAENKKSLETVPEFVKGLRRYYNVSTTLGFLALLSIVTAFALMVFFATKNASFL
jgi:ABC-type transporter Mla MlaB component